MNVGPANTIRPVNGAVEVRQQGGRDPSSFDQEELPPKEGHAAESDAGSEKKVDARETLRLLSEGRISGLDGARFRIHFQEAANDEKARNLQAEVRELTEAALAPLRELLNVGLFDEETKALLEEAFTQVESNAEALPEDDDEKAFDAERLYLNLQEAFEQYHAMLKRIFGLAERIASKYDEAAGEETVNELEEPTESAPNKEADGDGSTDEGGKTAAEQEEELMHRVVEAVEQAMEDLQEKMEDAESASSDEPGSEESEYAKFATAYENLSDVPANAASFNTEG